LHQLERLAVTAFVRVRLQHRRVPAFLDNLELVREGGAVGERACRIGNPNLRL
jgi:hypothetical protein